MLAAGLPIGKSLAEPALVDEARAVIAAMRARGAEVPMPIDVVTAKEFKADAAATVKAAADVARRRPDPRHRPADAPRRSPRCCSRPARSSGTARSACSSSTPSRTAPRRSRARSQRSTAFSIAGGGDTLAAIAKYGIDDRHRLHLDRRRRVPRGARRQDAAGVRDPRAARRGPAHAAATGRTGVDADNRAATTIPRRLPCPAPPRSSPRSARRRARPRCSSG